MTTYRSSLAGQGSRASPLVAPRARARPSSGPGALAPLVATQGPVCAQDPARMTPEARLRELGAILAAGFRRQHENNRSNCLGDRGHPERACETGTVNSPENPEEGSA